MMDTILNLGLNDATVKGLAAKSGNERFAYDSYRRFIQMYSNVVLGVDHGVFEDILDNHKNLNGFSLDTDLAADDWLEIIDAYKEAVERETGKPFPQEHARAAVGRHRRRVRLLAERARQHLSPPARHSRQLGHGGQRAGHGVRQPRRHLGHRRRLHAQPSTGTREIYGEFLINAQGEDVVAGIRTPQPLTEAARKEAGETSRRLWKRRCPTRIAQLAQVFDDAREALPRHAGHRVHHPGGQALDAADALGQAHHQGRAQDRRRPRRRRADHADEEAVLRIDAAGLDQLLHPTIDPEAERHMLATGLPASPGAASGEIVFDADEAEAMKAQGREVILVRVETSPEDIHGMHAAAGILTTRGGMTSHAAVVARGMGRPCVCGAGALRIDAKAGTMTVAGQTFRKGDVITIDGGKGEVLKGRVKMRQPELSGDFAQVMQWADAARSLGVRANADTPREARQAREFGAEGIGLCRTEHMFFEESRILAMREMICADDEAGRRRALAKILPMQRADFEALFEIMAGLPVTIRLLDPPLHEFLPHEDKEAAAVAKELGVPLEKLQARVAELHEFNPMLGFRGCRLAIRYPEITEMQARAIFEAAVSAAKKTGKPVVPEVMIPLVAYRREFDVLRAVIVKTAEAVAKETGAKLDYQIGTMIELPRAALKADEIAAGKAGAEFFSFGTNDLTQTCLGLSRDDAAPILANYTKHGIFEVDPFVSIDQGRRRRAGPYRHRARTQGAARPQGRHLRRARRRSGLDRLLPRGRPRLRVLLALPRAGGAPRRGAGGDQGEGSQLHALTQSTSAARRPPDAIYRLGSWAWC